MSSLKSQIKILTNRLESVAMNQMRSDLVNNEEESEEDSSVTIEMEELDRINKEVKQLEKEMGGKKAGNFYKLIDFFCVSYVGIK